MDSCETCKHWKPAEAWDATAGGLRRCGAVLEQWVVQDEIPKAIREGKYGCEEDGDPAAVAYMAAAEVVFSKRKAVVADGSQYHAELLTRPDFGCVLHEAS